MEDDATNTDVDVEMVVENCDNQHVIKFDVQPTDQTRNDHDTKQPEESPKNADTTYTDYTSRQAVQKNP